MTKIITILLGWRYATVSDVQEINQLANGVGVRLSLHLCNLHNCRRIGNTTFLNHKLAILLQVAREVSCNWTFIQHCFDRSSCISWESHSLQCQQLKSNSMQMHNRMIFHIWTHFVFNRAIAYSCFWRWYLSVRKSVNQTWWTLTGNAVVSRPRVSISFRKSWTEKEQRWYRTDGSLKYQLCIKKWPISHSYLWFIEPLWNKK